METKWYFKNIHRIIIIIVLLGFQSIKPSYGAQENLCQSVFLSKNIENRKAIFSESEHESQSFEFQKEIAKIAERNAIQIIDKAALSKQNALDEVQEWLFQIQKKQTQSIGLNVSEHTALVYLWKTKFFDKFGTPEVTESLKEQLILSREQLTGKVATEINLDQKLPIRLLLDASPETRLLYSAVFREDKQSHSMKDLIRGYIPKKSDIVTGIGALTLTAIAFTHSGGDKIAAAMMGLALATVAEHVFHRYGTHSKTLLEKTKNSWFGKTIENLFFNHTVVHHGKTFHNYTEKFKNEEHHQQVDKHILEKMGQQYLDNMQKNEYGITLTAKEYTALLIPLMPVHAILCSILGLDPMATALLIAPTLLYPAGVVIPHRYMHMTREQISEATQNKPVLRWLLKTRYSALMSAVHQNHHRNSNTNFNLAFIAGDALLGTLKLPSVEDLARLRKLGILGTTWGPSTFEKDL